MVVLCCVQSRKPCSEAFCNLNKIRDRCRPVAKLRIAVPPLHWIQEKQLKNDRNWLQGFKASISLQASSSCYRFSSLEDCSSIGSATGLLLAAFTFFLRQTMPTKKIARWLSCVALADGTQSRSNSLKCPACVLQNPRGVQQKCSVHEFSAVWLGLILCLGCPPSACHLETAGHSQATNCCNKTVAASLICSWCSSNADFSSCPSCAPPTASEASTAQIKDSTIQLIE